MTMSGGRLLFPLVGDSWIQYCNLLTPFCCLSLWHTHLAEAQGRRDHNRRSPSSPSALLTPPSRQMPLMRQGAHGLDMRISQGGGAAAGYIVMGPDGCPRGLGGYGGSDAPAAGGHERGFGLGDQSGGHNVGDGEEGRRGGFKLV